MNEVIKNIKTRRSVRQYLDKEVPDELIEKICEAGTYAPTGMNRQSPIIVAVSNREVRNKLQKMNASVMGSDNDPFYGAPVILIVLANKDVPTYMYDGSCVMQNLMLAAHSYGLSSCWIHRAKQEFESDEGKELLNQWGIEGNYEGIGHVILGYSDIEIEEKPRKDNYVYYVK